MINYVNIEWRDIDRICNDLKYSISIYSKIIPDAIISIGRGGMIPSRILSDLLSINEIYLFNIKLYKKGTTNRNIKPTIQPFNHNIENKNILLVDDIMDSGTTIEHVIQELQKKKPKSIKTLTLACKDTVNRKPSFYSFLTKQNEWIVFPWETTEFKNLKKEDNANNR